MSKHIKLEDAIDALGERVEIIDGAYSACAALRSLPTIDIVHCKDCKHATYSVKKRGIHDIFYACPYSSIQHEGKFFCAYGERIDNE